MAQEIVKYNMVLPEMGTRYDTINGVRTGPVLTGDVTWKTLRSVHAPEKTQNFAAYVMGGYRKPVHAYYRRDFTENMRGSVDNAPYLTLVWIPTGDMSEYYGRDTPTMDAPYLVISESQRNGAFNGNHMRILQKIKGQKVNLGVFAAERNQVIDMFAGTARKLGNAYTNVRKGNFKKAFEILQCRPSKRLSAKKSAANNWLELQYGWLPLLSDAYGAAEQLEETWEATEKKPPYATATARTRVGDKDVVAGAAQGVMVEREFIADCRSGVAYRVDYESSRFLGRVGLTNPLDIGWEALPFSFVVDWFLPVGRFLNTLDATLGCTFIDGYTAMTQYSHLRSWREGQWDVGNFRYIYKKSSNRGNGRYFNYERGGPMLGFPAVSLPQFKNPISAQHCANALALLTQAFSKR